MVGVALLVGVGDGATVSMTVGRVGGAVSGTVGRVGTLVSDAVAVAALNAVACPVPSVPTSNNVLVVTTTAAAAYHGLVHCRGFTTFSVQRLSSS